MKRSKDMKFETSMKSAFVKFFVKLPRAKLINGARFHILKRRFFMS